MDELRTEDRSDADHVQRCDKFKRNGYKIVIGLCLVGCLVYAIVDSFTTKNIQDLAIFLLEYIEKIGFWGGILFTLVYIVATVCLIPGSILTLGAGFVFTQTNEGNQLKGTLIATVVVFIGASVGGTIAFLIARFVLQDTAKAMTTKYRIFRAIDSAIETNGLKIVVLLRLSPAIPFNVLNYLLGTTSISLRNYTIACVGLLPGTMAFCFIGSSLQGLAGTAGGNDGEDEDSNSKTVRLVIIIVGVIASVIAIVMITIYAKRELNKALENEAQEGIEAVVPTPVDNHGGPVESFSKLI